MRNLLITGADHDERMKYATSLASTLLCENPHASSGCGQCHNCERLSSRTHPNLIIIEPEDAETNDIKIDAIRRLINENNKTNCEKGNAVFIITHMHQMTKAAANALLKSIEESHPQKIFLALAPSKSAVLPTIASRLVLQIIKAPALNTASYEHEIIKKIYSITTTMPIKRFLLCADFPETRAELIATINLFIDTCHELLRALYNQNHPLYAQSLTPLVALKLSDALHQTLEKLHKNANPRLAIEYLLLSEWPYACL